jgi:hypothetical protein
VTAAALDLQQEISVAFRLLPQHLRHDGTVTAMPLCCRSGP